VFRTLTVTAVATLAGACASTSSTRPFPLLAELGGQDSGLQAGSAAAQQAFDQGLTLYWSFDHLEATRCFERAAELAPDNPMPHWALALSAGPHINNPSMDQAREAVASAGLRAARARLDQADALGRALIEALDARYDDPPPADRRPLDEAYAAAMGELWRRFPDHPQVGALYAEALMDLWPWDLYAKDGSPRPGTNEIHAVLERVLELEPRHAGANHLNVHACEMSPTPERAKASADRLRTLVPGAAHLVHMPAHIDVRLGDYAAAVRANQAAVAAAKKRVKRSGEGGFYAVYRAHNYHFLVYAAQFEGRYELALSSARELVRQLPEEVVTKMPEFLEGFLPTPLHVLVRFGRWQEILSEPAPKRTLPSVRAFWHYARGLACSALGRIDEAAQEREAFEAAYAAIPEDYSIGNNPTKTVLDIGRSMLAGELLYRQRDYGQAFAHLRDAVAKDEALRYDEPWGWFQPAAHALGALLLEQGQLEEAEAVYRRDLELHPSNGWALVGLEECLRRRGEAGEAQDVAARFRESWKRSDVRIHSSCFCRTGP
jgi:tetratricopeptide (TPR) repeat protein